MRVCTTFAGLGFNARRSSFVGFDNTKLCVSVAKTAKEENDDTESALITEESPLRRYRGCSSLLITS